MKTFSAMRACPTRKPSRSGFSLLELITSISILAIILLVVFNITNETSKTWKRSTAKIEQFQSARRAFESISRNLAQATLNTYWDYMDSSNPPEFRKAGNSANFKPARYARNSELHFITGQADAVLANSGIQTTTPTHAVFFQAPLGTGATVTAGNFLNACGYFVSFGEDTTVPKYVSDRPGYKASKRFRLFEFVETTEALAVYKPGAGLTDWFNASDKAGDTTSSSPKSRPIADNIVAFVVFPQKSDRKPFTPESAESYSYDSRIPIKNPQQETSNQLPPLLEVVMIAIDETSAQRLLGTTGTINTISEAATALGGIKYDTLFTNPAKLEDDIKDVTEALVKEKANYRVFRTKIAIRSANWSS